MTIVAPTAIPQLRYLKTLQLEHAKRFAQTGLRTLIEQSGQQELPGVSCWNKWTNLNEGSHSHTCRLLVCHLAKPSAQELWLWSPRQICVQPLPSRKRLSKPNSLKSELHYVFRPSRTRTTPLKGLYSNKLNTTKAEWETFWNTICTIPVEFLNQRDANGDSSSPVALRISNPRITSSVLFL